MDTKISPQLAVLILLGVASCFATNHLCARIAFDHGASVVTGVSVRATFTMLVLFIMMRLQGVSLAIPRELRGRTLLAGLLIASQSYCLYSAVALIPPALALLVFQTSPMLYVLLTWALGRETPRWSALWPMAFALAGLALALNLRPAHLAADWAAVRAGVGWAFASGASMAVVYYLNANALKGIDGRLRTFAMTAVTAVLVIVGGSASGAQAFPQAASGWAGLALLAVFYCIAMGSLFFVLPRIPTTTTAALNFEPIALLALGWTVLGFTVTPVQIGGAVLTVSAIVWLGLAKR
ncbi:MAG TPA: DMT family transporter [Burkholderiales bacterium]|nr:DMT family transporter [Burkholderiales bacterium]